MLQNFLKQNKEVILKDWIDQTINTYNPEMIRFLKKEKNQFSNPVRNTIITSLEKIYDSLLTGEGVDDDRGLEEIIKVRAVQDFSPSDALAFIFDLKTIIRTKYSESDQNSESMDEFYNIDNRFDLLFKKAFDLYNDCRMKIQDIKISEIKSRSERAFERLNKQ